MQDGELPSVRWGVYIDHGHVGKRLLIRTKVHLQWGMHNMFWRRGGCTSQCSIHSSGTVRVELHHWLLQERTINVHSMLRQGHQVHQGDVRDPGVWRGE